MTARAAACALNRLMFALPTASHECLLLFFELQARNPCRVAALCFVVLIDGRRVPESSAACSLCAAPMCFLSLLASPRVCSPLDPAGVPHGRALLVSCLFFFVFARLKRMCRPSPRCTTSWHVNASKICDSFVTRTRARGADLGVYSNSYNAHLPWETLPRTGLVSGATGRARCHRKNRQSTYKK